MELTDRQREQLVSLYPWIPDLDAVLENAGTFSEAVARLRSMPVRKVTETRRGKRRKKVR